MSPLCLCQCLYDFASLLCPLLLSWDSTWEATGYNTYPIPMQAKTRMRALKKTMTVVFVLSFPSKQTFILFPAFHRPCKKDLVLHPLTFDNAAVCQISQVWYCFINTGRLLLFVFLPPDQKRNFKKNCFSLNLSLSVQLGREACHITVLHLFIVNTLNVKRSWTWIYRKYAGTRSIFSSILCLLQS